MLLIELTLDLLGHHALVNSEAICVAAGVRETALMVDLGHMLDLLDIVEWACLDKAEVRQESVSQTAGRRCRFQGPQNSPNALHGIWVGPQLGATCLIM
jgi:hypothetical protein